MPGEANGISRNQYSPCSRRSSTQCQIFEGFLCIRYRSLEFLGVSCGSLVFYKVPYNSLGFLRAHLGSLRYLRVP